MKRISLLILIALILSVPARAQSEKTIILKDGTVLKGSLVELKNNIYTIQTSHLGQVQINESDITSINSGQAPAVSNSNLMKLTGGNSELTGKMQEMQQNIMENPEIMKEITALVSDEEIQILLKDPQLVQDISTMDPARVQDNGKVQALMQNQKFKALIDKLQQSFAPASSNQQ